jgi:hypothetical protein
MGGFSGYLVDESGDALANVDFWYAGPRQTDRNGFFAILMLEPGLYWAPSAGGDVYQVSDCPLIPVFDGETTFVRITAERVSLFCRNISVLPFGLVDANQGEDLSRI